VALSAAQRRTAQALLAGKDREAQNRSDDYQAIFGRKNYYLELMDHGSRPERLNEKLLELSKEDRVPLVATNDCHYLKKEMRRLTTAPVHRHGIDSGGTSRAAVRRDEFYTSLRKRCMRFLSTVQRRCAGRLKLPNAARRYQLDQMLSAALRSAFPNGRRVS